MTSASASSFTSNLSRGMHSAAQPLAILRARFYPELIKQMKKGDLLELALSSTVQIERLCTLFGYLQQLVTAESIAPRVAETQIGPLMKDAVEGVELWFEDSGISLASDASYGSKTVLADRQRTLQAMSAVLMIAHSFSTKGDKVTMATENTENGVAITLRSPNSTTETLTAEASLGMAVAEAQLSSQGGRLSYNLNPLVVTLQLPAAA